MRKQNSTKISQTTKSQDNILPKLEKEHTHNTNSFICEGCHPEIFKRHKNGESLPEATKNKRWLQPPKELMLNL
jgi:hypothetical protein